MSPYATHLARARLDALRQLVIALNQAESPDEKRRCAVAIFNAPDPCELDDVIELDDDLQNSQNDPTQNDESTSPVPPSIAAFGDRRCDAATHASQPATSVAPAADSLASTSVIAHPTPDLDIDNLSDEEIIAETAKLMNSPDFPLVLAHLNSLVSHASLAPELIAASP